MDVIIKEYGGIIITVIAIVAFIAIVRLVIGNDTTSIIYQAFVDILTRLFENTGLSAT